MPHCSVTSHKRHICNNRYRHIDCAWIYRNQEEVGEAIQESIAESVVTREQLWVTSKLWNTAHAKDQVEPHCREILLQLNLDYLDLFLIHWPVVAEFEGEILTPSYKETWLAMENLVRIGLVKSIGVSNMSAKKIREMKEYATIFPVVNQVELHPFLRQDEVLAACSEMGVHLTAYSPLGSPDSAEMIKHEGASVMAHPTVTAIAEEVSKEPAQVLIRWAVQRGTSVIPKSTQVITCCRQPWYHKFTTNHYPISLFLHLHVSMSLQASRLASNFDVFSWELSPEQFARLSSIEPQVSCLFAWKQR